MLRARIFITDFWAVVRLSLVLLILGPIGLEAQGPVIIDHQPITCLSSNDFIAITAGIRSEAELRTAKVYFRAETHPDFYFVEMTRVGENYQAYLPLPEAETRRVVYYIEAVDSTFASNRTVEHDPKVTSTGECKNEDPLAAWFFGDSPNIIVGAVRTGLAALPPGFQAAGIAGLASTGGGGGGLVAGVAVGAAAGAGATVGVLVSQGNEPESTTSTVRIDSQPTTTSFPTTSTPGGVSSTTTTTPATSTVAPPTSSTTTTIVTSTTTIAPTTTTTSPTTTTISPTTTIPGTTTTTIPPSTTTSPALSACFTVQDDDGAAGCRVDFDASCSTGNIVSYAWQFQDDPPYEETTIQPTITYDWSDNPECGTPFSRLVRLTVTGQGGATAMTQAIIDPTSPAGLRTIEEALRPVETSFTTLLEPHVSSGRIEAHLITNGNQVDVTDNATPYRHLLEGRAGKNTIEAAVTSAAQVPVALRLDFTGSEHFVPGSLRVETGSVTMQSSHSVLLRLTGVPGERIRVTFLLKKEN